jgi:hypothetical protein
MGFSLRCPRHPGPLRRAHEGAGTPEDVTGNGEDERDLIVPFDPAAAGCCAT